MTPAQSRAARGLLKWSQDELSDRAGISAVTIRKFEGENGGMRPRNIGKLRAAMEAAGVLFQDADQDGGPGVRLANIPEAP